MGQKLPVNLKTWKPSGQLVTTIYEHSDIVTCLETIKDCRYFASGSYDGYVRIFDLEKLESYFFFQFLINSFILKSDFTIDSVGFIKCEGNNEDQDPNNRQKIKVLRSIEDSFSILLGTNDGIIDLYRVNI